MTEIKYAHFSSGKLFLNVQWVEMNKKQYMAKKKSSLSQPSSLKEIVLVCLKLEFKEKFWSNIILQNVI